MGSGGPPGRKTAAACGVVSGGPWAGGTRWLLCQLTFRGERLSGLHSCQELLAAELKVQACGVFLGPEPLHWAEVGAVGHPSSLGVDLGPCSVGPAALAVALPLSGLSEVAQALDTPRPLLVSFGLALATAAVSRGHPS